MIPMMIDFRNMPGRPPYYFRDANGAEFSLPCQTIDLDTGVCVLFLEGDSPKDSAVKVPVTINGTQVIASSRIAAPVQVFDSNGMEITKSIILNHILGLPKETIHRFVPEDEIAEVSLTPEERTEANFRLLERAKSVSPRMFDPIGVFKSIATNIVRERKSKTTKTTLRNEPPKDDTKVNEERAEALIGSIFDTIFGIPDDHDCGKPDCKGCKVRRLKRTKDANAAPSTL